MSVSIIIPTRNREAFLEKCLQRLVGQVSQGDEVLVSDNGSSDNTRNVVLQFSGRLPVKYLFEPRKGPSFARNLGVKKARGEIIAFLDDDCLVSQNWLAEIKKISQKSNKGTVYQGRINHHFLEENFLSQIFFLRHKQEWRLVQRNLGWRKGRFINFLNSGNFFLRKESLDRLDYVFDTKTFPFIGEERDLAARLQLAGYKIVYAPTVAVRHMKGKPRLFKALRVAFKYGRTEGILETKYTVEPDIKKLFKETGYFLEEDLSPKEKIFAIGNQFLNRRPLFYLGVITFLLAREIIYTLGRAYGRLIAGK